MSSLSKEVLASLPQLSLRQLLALALEHEIIDGGVITSDGRPGELGVHIHVGSKDLWLEGEEGALFIRGLVRGYDLAMRRSSN